MTFDEIGQALAIVLEDGLAAETVDLADGVLLDIDADGRPLGIEFVSLARVAPFFAAHGGEYVLPDRVVAREMSRRQSA
jgi:uncharacterized protein YuzE